MVGRRDDSEAVAARGAGAEFVHLEGRIVAVVEDHDCAVVALRPRLAEELFVATGVELEDFGGALGLRALGDGVVERAARRFHVALQLHGRDVERFADVVEAVRLAVFRQQFLELGANAEQVAERVFVFDAVEPTDDGVPLGGRGFDERLTEACHERVFRCRRQRRRVGRGHLARGDPIEDADPFRELSRLREVDAEFFQIEASFGRRAGVALIAMRPKQRAKVGEPVVPGGAGERSR